MKKPIKPFPATVFLRWEGDPPYLIGSPSLSQAIDNEDEKILGCFKLVQVVETKRDTKYRPIGTKTWAEFE